MDNQKRLLNLFLFQLASEQWRKMVYMIGGSFEMVKRQFDFINLLVLRILRNYMDNFERTILTTVGKMDE